MTSELTEVDIPGSSLGSHKPEALKFTELKFWLRNLCCRGVTGLSKLKTKADYVQQ